MIKPLSIPDAAGLDFAQGDVRHLAPGDPMDETTISRATRHLAKRDSLIAAVVNNLVQQVNNKEQLISIQPGRLTLPPSVAIVVANHRIPTGFEARVLNAIVSSTPAAIGKLDVLY